VDTFRADRAGCMGHPGGLTPTIDRVARCGLLARHAYASAPVTAVAHASLLTGLRPPTHGVRNNGHFVLSESLPTLASLLHENGFRTGGFIAAVPLEGRFGFSRGFERYDDFLGAISKDAAREVVDPQMAQRPGGEVVDSTLAWVRGLPNEDRWFAWAHFFDPHQPRDVKSALRKLPAADDYDREIRGMDCEIDRLLKGLSGARQGRVPVVALCSDHGEALGERGEMTHGILLYEPTVRAFVALAAPPGTAERKRLPTGVYEDLVAFCDLVPTLFDLLGLDLPADLEGRSLLREPGSAPGVYGETYVPLLRYGWSPLVSWRDARWYFIESPDPELFEYDRDPGLTRNVRMEHPEIAAELSAKLRELRREPQSPDSEALPEETRRRLLALGYVSTPTAVPVNLEKNPRDLIEVSVAITSGAMLAAEGKASLALAQFQKAYRLDPDNVGAAFGIGNCMRQLGNRLAAMSYYRKAIEMSPHAGVAYAHLAVLEADAGRTERAWRLLAEGLAHNPDNYALLMTAGDMHTEDGDHDRAAEFYHRAAQQEPRSIDPWVRLAETAAARGLVKDSRAAWLRVYELDPQEPRIPAAVRQSPRSR
jgi:arylsulfatase A-like enzyme/Flp pilus assembly protein TadD